MHCRRAPYRHVEGASLTLATTSKTYSSNIKIINIDFLIFLTAVQRLSVLITYAKNGRSLIGQKCMKRCFQKEVKILYGEISCGKNFGDEISSGDIERGENIMRKILMRRKFYAAKFPAEKFPVTKLTYSKHFMRRNFLQ